MRPGMIVLAALVLTVASFAQDTGIGVVNGGFEGDEDGDGLADGWAFSAGADEGALDVTFSLDPGRDGGTAQRIDCTRWEAGHAMLAQVGTVTIEAGESYRVELWLRAEGDPRVGVGIHDTDGWQHCGLWRMVSPPDTWRRYAWRFTGTHDCHETSRLQIWFSSTGTVWGDDLVVERIEPSARPDIIQDIGSKNLVPNSSFECGPDRWISAGCWRLFGEVVEESAVHGSRCMKVAWSPETAPVLSFDYYDPRRDLYARPAITSEGWMRVQEGAQYVLSAWLRADQETPCRLRALGPQRQYAGATVTLGADWRRFELPFTAAESLCHVQIDVDWSLVRTDDRLFWLDALQLERGESATEYEPRRPIEIGVTPRNGTGIFFGDQPTMLDVGIANASAEPVEVEVTVAATDGLDRPVREMRRTLTVPPGSLFGEIEAVSLSAFNRVTVSSEHTDPCLLRIARLPELQFEDSPFGINHAYAWDPFVELARRIGILWVRDWSLKWDHVEPEPGRWEFEMAEYQINRPLGLGMNVLCMFPFPSAGWSSTAPPLEEVPEALRARAPYRIRTAYAPRDPAELERYVFECVRRLGDRIDVWEVFNESIFTSYSLPRQAGYTATDYIPLLEAVSRGCRRADPDCLVMGGYSVPPANFEELHRPFIEAGGLEFCDLYSLHVYPGGEPEFIAGQLDRITDLMGEHGGVKPMWMTEYAYYADDDPDPVPRGWPTLIESELTQAAWNTRMCVTQLAHGVEKVFYHIWHTQANRDSAARIFFEYGGAPRRIAASQAAMAQMLGPRPEFLRAVQIGENMSCYLFRNERGPDGEGPALVAVAWHHWDDVDWGALADRDLRDMFGVPIAEPDPPALPGPVYLVEREMSPDDFATAIERAMAP